MGLRPGVFGGQPLERPAYKGIIHRTARPLENTDLVMNNLFWIGVYPGIDEVQMNFMCDVIQKFMEKRI